VNAITLNWMINNMDLQALVYLVQAAQDETGPVLGNDCPPKLKADLQELIRLGRDRIMTELNITDDRRASDGSTVYARMEDFGGIPRVAQIDESLIELALDYFITGIAR